MKKTLLFLMAAFYCLEMSAQRNIDGIYVDRYDKDHRIELSNGKFRFIKQFYRPITATSMSGKAILSEPERYLYAEADYEWIDDEFIEFHSKKPANVVDSLLEIKKKTTAGDSQDRKTIKVIIPEIYYKSLNVTVFYDNMRLISTGSYVKADDWKKGETKRESNYLAEFSVPAKTTQIYLKVEPDDIYRDYDGDDVILYNSYLVYETPALTLYNDYVEITINGIDDSYFGRHYINGEYARVTEDKIVWCGHVFEKIPD